MILENFQRGRTDKLKFHSSLYFVVVTLSTVGYGDIIPESALGQVMVIFIIAVTIAIIPRQTNELLRFMAMQSVFARQKYKANTEVPFILVTGEFNLESLKNFSTELFHKDHGNMTKNIVML